VLFNGGDVWKEQLNISGVQWCEFSTITFGSYGTGRPVDRRWFERGYTELKMPTGQAVTRTPVIM